MNGDTAVELGDGVIMSFVEVCLFFYHLRQNDWKWTDTLVHYPLFFFFLKMLSLLTMVEVGSVAFLTVSTLSVMPTTYSSVVTEPTHSTAMNLTPEVVVVSLVSFLDLVRGQT